MKQKANWADLLRILKEKALEFGEYKLSSGFSSAYYIDGRRVTLDSKGTYLTAALFLEALWNDKFNAIGGPTVGADPIVGAISALSYSQGRPVDAFIVRKHPKIYGKRQWIEGPLKEGSKVVIVDDVSTTGESILKAIERVEEIGCKVVKVVVLVERLEGGARKKLKQRGYDLTAIFTSKDLGVGE